MIPKICGERIASPEQMIKGRFYHFRADHPSGGCYSFAAQFREFFGVLTLGVRWEIVLRLVDLRGRSAEVLWVDYPAIFELPEPFDE